MTLSEGLSSFFIVGKNIIKTSIWGGNDGKIMKKTEEYSGLGARAPSPGTVSRAEEEAPFCKNTEQPGQNSSTKERFLVF